jgi:hypothetical protein
MARGHQKALSQQKNQAKQQQQKRGEGSNQKAAAAKALTYKCTVCMVRLPNYRYLLDPDFFGMLYLEFE